MLVIVTTAAALLAMLVVVMLVLVTATAALLTMLVVVMLVLVTATAALLAVLVVVMLVVMVMVLAVLSMLCFKLCYGRSESILIFHCRENILAVKRSPWSSHYHGRRIVLTDKLNSLGHLCLLCHVCVREDNTGRVAYLVVIELAKVLHIHFAFCNIGDGGKAVEDAVLAVNLLNSLDNIRELTYARGLNDNSVGVKLVEHTAECLCKIAYKRAADTARVHLGNLYAGILKKSSVNAYLAKLILDKNNPLARICFLNQLLYERGLSRTEKA